GGAEGKAGRVNAVREVDMEAGRQGGQMQKIYTIRQVDRRRTMVHHKTAHHLDMQPGSHGHARYQPVTPCTARAWERAQLRRRVQASDQHRPKWNKGMPHPILQPVNPPTWARHLWTPSAGAADPSMGLDQNLTTGTSLEERIRNTFRYTAIPTQENIVHDCGALSVAENGYMGRRAEGWAVLEDVWVGTEWATGI
ncbi:hypothetical protein GQ607_005639, partial [Colletotrichum asianum]